MSSKKKKLTPPDPKQCQAEKPNGNSFMTLGGRPGMLRCENKPSVIVYENKPGVDGQKGAMSLCKSCLAVLNKQMPVGYVRVEAIA